MAARHLRLLVALPLLSVMLPLTPDDATPDRTSTTPVDPLVDAPVAMLTAPLAPAVVTSPLSAITAPVSLEPLPAPVAMLTAPLSPLLTVFAVHSVTSPDA